MNKKPELTKQQKKRIDKVTGIIKKNLKSRKDNRNKIDGMLKKYGDIFDDICDDILFNLNEVQRATFVKILVETLLIRATLRGFILAGVLDHIHQDLVVQPLASVRLMKGKQIIKDTLLSMQQEKSEEKSVYIR